MNKKLEPSTKANIKKEWTSLDKQKEYLSKMKQKTLVENRNYYEFMDIKTYLKTTGIKCQKYNYSLDNQTRQKFEAIIKLSLDE